VSADKPKVAWVSEDDERVCFDCGDFDVVFGLDESGAPVKTSTIFPLGMRDPRSCRVSDGAYAYMCRRMVAIITGRRKRAAKSRTEAIEEQTQLGLSL